MAENSSSTAAPPKVEEKRSWADDVPEDEAPTAEAEPSESDDSDIEAVTSYPVYTHESRERKFANLARSMIDTWPYKDFQAQTPNGSRVKTECIILTMLVRVDSSRKVPQAIWICPTRELAQQNLAAFNELGDGITAFCAIPSDSANDIPIMKCQPVTDQVVIGTPGTIKKWMSAKKLATRDVELLVFDEADYMLAEDGFKDDSERITREIRNSSGSCQVLLFSATFNETVEAFISRVIKDGNRIILKTEEQLTLEKVKQYKVSCPDELAKIEVIKSRIFALGEKVGQTIIFVRTRDSASMLHGLLKAEGYECTSIHDALEKEDRDKIIKEFKDGYTKVLITTVLHGWGLDQEDKIIWRGEKFNLTCHLPGPGFYQAQVNLVINYDLPVKPSSPTEPHYEVYLHRIARAGHFERKSAVFNLVTTDCDRMIMEKIERHFQYQIPEVTNWRSEQNFEVALKDAGLL